MFHNTLFRRITLLILFLGSVAYAFVAKTYGLELLAEIAILAILAISLDLVAGFGGMVSLCHGALMGAGAYAYTVLASHFGLPPSVAILITLVFTACVGWIIGAVGARSHGIYFIMATLAIGQIGYVFVFESPFLGGDDGLSDVPRPDLSAIGIDLGNSQVFALACIVAVALAFTVAACTLRSGLGHSLVGIMHNEKRMRALGLGVWQVKALAFGISGGIAGFAGILAAQQAMFVSPGLMSWTVSGEALVVVILGGLGTLVGPIVGAILFVMLKHEVSGLTPYWHLIVGLILIAVVMSRADGVYGWIEQRWIKHKQKNIASPAVEKADDHA